ncbi:MAG TPA: glutaredoxin 3 [Steroidobacter sp.]
MSEAPEVLMYSTDWCGYCQRARNLLARKGVQPREIKVDEEPDARATMLRETGRRTVPQIFIGGRHVGGYDELAQLERSGELDKLLGRPSEPAAEPPETR